MKAHPACPSADLAREEKAERLYRRKLTPGLDHILNGFLQSPNRSSLVCIEPYGADR